jgi:hypothetical protein
VRKNLAKAALAAVPDLTRLVTEKTGDRRRPASENPVFPGEKGLSPIW